MKKFIAVMALVIFGALLLYGTNTFAPHTPTVGTNDPRNIAYTIDGNEVLLRNGVAEEEIAPGTSSKIITRYFGNEVRADMNHDGSEDMAFLLTQDGGGSGIFYYVVVALGSEQGYHGTNAILIGDRIAPQTTEYRAGEIIVNYADRASGEPMSTRPSLGVSRYFVITNGELIETKK